MDKIDDLTHHLTGKLEGDRFDFLVLPIFCDVTITLIYRKAPNVWKLGKNKVLNQITTKIPNHVYNNVLYVHNCRLGFSNVLDFLS